MLLIIDNYDSFTYNLYHYFGELGYIAKVYRNDEKSSDFLIKVNPKYFVISPGPSSPNNAGICLELIKKNSELRSPIPTLGVCLGHQAIAQAFNSKIIQSGKPVHCKVSLIHHNNLGLFNDLKSPFKATRYHSLIIDKKSISKNLNKLITLNIFKKITSISCGDDYQILFTASPSKARIISKISKSLRIKISKIGKISDYSEKSQIIDEKNKKITILYKGYFHKF